MAAKEETENFFTGLTKGLSKEEARIYSTDADLFSSDCCHTESSRCPEFKLPVNPASKATKINLLSIARPHMRAFHFAWLSFFLSFFAWFSIPPLVTTIEQFDHLSPGEKDNTDILASAGTVLARLIIGPLADEYGPRTMQLTTLTVFSIPVFLTGATFNYASLAVCRFFIGMVGAAFVVTEFWTNLHFAPNIVGLATSTTAGWGNAGAGVANALMPQIYNLFQDFGLDKDKAWRACYIVPGILLWIVGLNLYFFSDDCPRGNYKELIASSERRKVPFLQALKRASFNYVAWLLFIAYAISFGVEVLLNIRLSSYFQSRFSVIQSKAGLAAGLFGLTNIFARTLGGVCSDMSAKYFGMRGRLWSLFLFLILEGVFCLVFYEMSGFGSSIGVLVPFSIFVQCSTGCVFSIVPFVLPTFVGGVAGLVGAGGNVGSVVFGFLWKLPGVSNDPGKPFFFLSFFILGLAFVVPFIHFPKYGSMFFSPRNKIQERKNSDRESAHIRWIPMKIDEEVESLSISCVEVLNKKFSFDCHYCRCLECNRKEESVPSSPEFQATCSSFADEVKCKSQQEEACYVLNLEITILQTSYLVLLDVVLSTADNWILKSVSFPVHSMFKSPVAICKLEE
ncbi:MFS transporter, nitrate/nitrite transport [Galdieria sulphuraria]|uniref:MFS transporter, nitrate/nitrite transport n=1 Tax=Galdieria sulphuraria TaxID=130081 RepID=M2WV78_GALSU|nr:MFS transporter, nitrate/nitrite transport [Galdieria sulphuraria]EME27860.1 MFS transporter, nitrate/nitrite transport [Galdieria sulphuraria]|eukprot:XP_005704380.1 MFS transporter, nitrate/nitrite transport [Galdieria sulphuraria]